MKVNALLVLLVVLAFGCAARGAPMKPTVVVVNLGTLTTYSQDGHFISEIDIPHTDPADRTLRVVSLHKNAAMLLYYRWNSITSRKETVLARVPLAGAGTVSDLQTFATELLGGTETSEGYVLLGNDDLFILSKTDSKVRHVTGLHGAIAVVAGDGRYFVADSRGIHIIDRGLHTIANIALPGVTSIAAAPNRLFVGTFAYKNSLIQANHIPKDYENAGAVLSFDSSTGAKVSSVANVGRINALSVYRGRLFAAEDAICFGGTTSVKVFDFRLQQIATLFQDKGDGVDNLAAANGKVYALRTPCEGGGGSVAVIDPEALRVVHSFSHGIDEGHQIVAIDTLKNE